jgi:DNA mismatch repair protein MutS
MTADLPASTLPNMLPDTLPDTPPLTPVMRQYAELKAQYPEALLLFRMGDFYELFAEDALIASQVLQITLTRRRTAKEGDAGTPMCGVPFHAAEGYIGKLLQAGHRVALAEQLESPAAAKQRGGSGALLQRKVVRLFTPGTLTEEAFLEAKRPSLLAVVAAEEEDSAPQRLVLAWLDLSTGEVGLRGLGAAQLAHTLAALPIGELVIPPALTPLLEGIVARKLLAVQPQLFAASTARAALARAYGVADPSGLGLAEPARQIAVGALVGYAELTQMGALPKLRPPVLQLPHTHLQLDAPTRQSLNLTHSPSGQRQETLLGILDETLTAAGGRLLARWLSEPLAQVAPILSRQTAVTTLVKQPAQRQALRQGLQGTGDVARAVSRLLLGRGSPRDLALLRSTGHALPQLQHALAGATDLLATYGQQLGGLEGLTDLLGRALAADPLPALVRDGNFIADGFDADLDRLRTLQRNAQQLLADLETTEATQSGLSPKLRYNQVWGYYLEVPKSAANFPPHWVHRQTTTISHRYTTPALLQLERDLGSAAAQAQAREEALLADLVTAVQTHSIGLLNVSEALASLDVLQGLAEAAVKYSWVAPMVEDSGKLELMAAKHPVVAAHVADFVANSVALNSGELWLLTGPNMAGKSTFLRQTALLVVLAQMGSYVPASQAIVGVADAIFCRVGAADNLAAGQSTFMVEMLETANILNRAGPRSLIILDELGRGTATYDGLALAWACVEDLVQRVHGRTLFATHYHELTALAEQLNGVSNHQLAVKLWQDTLVFLHQVQPGAAQGSYGVQVARLAGVPNNVVQRAQTLLQGFEAAARAGGKQGVARLDNLSLFATPVASAATQPSAVESTLRCTDVDGLAPREALALLYQLKGLLNPPTQAAEGPATGS